MWLYIVDYQISQIGTFKFLPEWYDLLIGCSYYLYISHYLWLAIIVKGILIKFDLSFTTNLFLCVSLTLAVTFVTYGVLLKII